MLSDRPRNTLISDISVRVLLLMLVLLRYRIPELHLMMPSRGDLIVLSHFISITYHVSSHNERYLPSRGRATSIAQSQQLGHRIADIPVRPGGLSAAFLISCKP